MHSKIRIIGESIDPWGLPLDEQPTADTAPEPLSESVDPWGIPAIMRSGTESAKDKPAWTNLNGQTKMNRESLKQLSQTSLPTGTSTSKSLEESVTSGQSQSSSNDLPPLPENNDPISEDSQALNLLKRKFEEFKPKFSKAVYRHAFKAIGLTDANDYAEIISVPIVLKKLSNLVGGQFNGKQIVINSKAATEDQIETLLHEMIHVAVYQWYGNEDHSHGAFFEAIHEKVIGPMPDSWKQELGESVDRWGMPFLRRQPQR